MENNLEKFIQSNSPDGGFLQSDEWRKFQESVGRKTYNISLDNFWANIIEHSLPIVGKYFYVPRDPVLCHPERAKRVEGSSEFNTVDSSATLGMTDLLNLAKKEKVGWIRIEPANDEILDAIKNSTNIKIKKAPHDMQPKEILMLDITKSEEELLAGMKQKTRYNIRLAEKKGIEIHLISNSPNPPNKNSNDKIRNFHPERSRLSGRVEGSSESKVVDSSTMLGMTEYINEFIKLVKITAKRDKITPHPENYYCQMFETIPGDILKLYVAEYQGKIIAANIVIHYEKIATYLHGASDNEHRNLMAPYLLQWQAIKDAKAAGCEKYDFGGIRTKTGEGITKFKLGFAPGALPVEFPGSYDIILNPLKYKLYRIMQKIKGLV